MIVITALCCVAVLSGCGWVRGIFGEDDPPGAEQINVFDAQVGQCFEVPVEPRVQLSELTVLPCDQPHQRELYALIEYVAPAGGDSSIYPGEPALAAFAEGACAEQFADYVGISYLDSALFFTYLLPSARGWEAEPDRAIACFVTATDRVLDTSVKGSKI